MQSEKEINREVEHFYLLLAQLRKQITQLKRDNQHLRQENTKLIAQKEKNEQNKADRFSVLGESERIALRHQVEGLIAKIDKHLE